MGKETYRPHFHFSAEKNWINDPNGLYYLDGEYHLFYQHHPESEMWGPMHWGHAISQDLLHWEHRPIALFPDEQGMIFSGSAVVDDKNTSGLQEDGFPTIIALFTHHNEGHETQSLAYSNDKGRTWTKYPHNPVIENPGLKDFRDPKVFRYENQWIMSLACGDHIRFYKSENLLNWAYLSSFGQDYGAHGGVWECPDLVRFQTEEGEKWVLIVSINPGGPNGGSAIQYFTGEFDGEVFHCDQPKEYVKWADFGRDFYAAVTWSNLPQPLWIGWMNNWQYANEGPTHPFRGSMSIPRKLSLENVEGEAILVQKPVSVELLVERIDSHLVHIGAVETVSHILPKQSRVIAEFKKTAIPFDLSIKGEGEEIKIVFDPSVGTFSLDRTNLKDAQFSEHFMSIDTMPVKHLKNLEMIIDECSVEIFVNQGAKVMTELFYMSGDEFELEWRAKSKELQLEYTVQKLKANYQKLCSE
ncbi:glycoside hydrolase family 32 protein [Pseudalkalibacillus hwajinpoensis]|uniref:glycoside hydrolase family 32 protein n=1 Tax=Guptibacillus hwajinpoensis TaxID=208199 RepID=UPI001CD31520|nr:glycoside hydrolase family 32 protein [Pseudalkalibacillus hwajinpoensis]MCA0990700.1 glycoside hydrolase family 32 protein [Pseudalkalibacillus hwajinpoensis]